MDISSQTASQRYRLKFKEDPIKWQAYLDKEKNCAILNRRVKRCTKKKNATTPTEKTRARTKQWLYRASLKYKSENAGMSLGYSTVQSKGKAMSRVKKSLPKDDAKKKEVVMTLFMETFPSEARHLRINKRISFTMPKLTSEQKYAVNNFYKRDDISRETPESETQKEPNMHNFAGKVVLITGASSGIGAGTAEYLAKLGADLSLTGRNKENLERTVRNCQKINKDVKTHVIQADITKNPEDVIDKTIKHFGKLDVLVNNAGILAFGSIENSNIDQFDSVINTNLRSAFMLTKLAAPYLEKTHGNIVNVSSVAGIRSFPGALSYCVSKAALDQLTKCTALELAPKRIRVNAVNPGLVVTQLQKRCGMDDITFEGYVDQSKSGHALGRVGEIAEIASGIAYLASNEASFITGILLPIDGGKQAMCPS